jgi:CRISPR system Cascade subunit CasC
MKLIELHIIQSFPVTCLNRDDVGAPKTAYFGGCQRARVSSQSWKRAIRTMAKETDKAVFGGCRTRLVVDSLATAYEGAGQDPTDAKTLARATADALGKLDDKNEGKVKTLLYFSEGEVKNVVEAMLGLEYADLVRTLADESSRKQVKEKAEGDLGKLAQKAVKSMGGAVKDAADICIFGRMVADDHTLTLEGAGLFSHAISTHKVANEIDFFSAVDDNNIVDEGAGHIGTLEFNSACYYRYVGLNVDLLHDEKHLAHVSREEFEAVVDAFLRASVLAVPQARKNSMFGHNPPAYVLGLQRQGQPLSLVNAFETPIRGSGGYVQCSIEELKKHWETLKKLYGLEATEIELPPKSLNEVVQGITEELINGRE